MKRALVVGFVFALLAMPAQANQKVFGLKTTMRKLWSEHVIWTRNYVMEAIAGSPAAKPVSVRLLQNQDDIGAVIATYYGKEAGAKLADLLKSHVLIAAKLIDAAKADNKDAQDEADAEWHDNAVEIATFLSDANPKWSVKMLTGMLNSHLLLTTKEVVARVKKDWTGDIKAFDGIYDQALVMADSWTKGIVKQFPRKFGLAAAKANAKTKPTPLSTPMMHKGK